MTVILTHAQNFLIVGHALKGFTGHAQSCPDPLATLSLDEAIDTYLGAEHSDGAVEGGVDVGVIIAAHGSKPRLKHRTLCL